MHHVRKVEEVPYSPDQMFRLVADVDRYQEFLPWCQESRVLETDGDEVVAELRVGYGMAGVTFATRNRNRPGEAIEMELERGPFDTLAGEWRFESRPGGGTRLTLDLRFELATHLLETTFASVLGRAASRLASAFRHRAEAVYGPDDA